MRITGFDTMDRMTDDAQEIAMSFNRIALSRRGFMIGAAVLPVGMRHGVIAQTPVTSDPPLFAERIGELLALVPPSPDDPRSNFDTVFTFADIERQLAATGMSRSVGGDLPDRVLAVTEALPLASIAFQYTRSPEWSDTFGFEPLTVARTLESGEPPNTVSIFAGGIDPDRVLAALLAAGYREVDQESGGSYLTHGDELDLTSVVGQLSVGSMNQAVVSDDLVIFTREEAMIQQVTQVMAGNSPSILETGAWPDLLSTFASDVVGIVVLHPSALAEFGDISSIDQIAFGVREGADNRDILEADDRGEELPEPVAIADFPEGRARVQVRIRYTDVATASAEAEAISRRWSEVGSIRTGQPLTELMVVEDARVAESDPTVAAIDFRVTGQAGWWYQIIFRNDLAAFVPEG